MKPTTAAIVTFVVAGLVTTLAVAFGWIFWADATDYFDREGSTGMAVIFVFAPIGGLAVGIAAAIAAYKLVKRRWQT